MTYDEALEYIHSVSWTFCKPGLDRIITLTEALGRPQDSLKFIHVAGTNGKGSFCSMTDSILRSAGYKVGLFTSPYIMEFGERMRVGGENIKKEVLAEITAAVRPIADAMEDKPTEFELITAIALEYFRKEACDVVVLECGLGGRLDSTNVINTAILSVITGISLDHTAILGDTVEAIAGEKAGIIKSGAPVIFGGTDPSAAKVIKARADECGASFITPDYDAIRNLTSSLRGTRFDYKGWQNVRLNLLGLYQPRNAALVLEAVDILRSLGFYITDSAVREGLESAVWHARFEIINHMPTVIFDGAHNPEGIASAVASIEHYFKDRKVIAVTGVLKDKDYNFIAEKIARVASRAYTITPDNDRALSGGDYAALLNTLGVRATPASSISEAISLAVADADRTGDSIVCLGSLYTYGDVRASVVALCISKRR